MWDFPIDFCESVDSSREGNSERDEVTRINLVDRVRCDMGMGEPAIAGRPRHNTGDALSGERPLVTMRSNHSLGIDVEGEIFFDLFESPSNRFEPVVVDLERPGVADAVDVYLALHSIEVVCFNPST